MIRSAALVTIGSGLSLAAAVASQLVQAYFFGTGAEMDAFLAAVVIPSYVQALFLTGISFVLMPAFIREVGAGREREGWNLVGTVSLAAGTLMCLLSLAGVYAAPQILALSAPGLSSSTSEAAVGMLRILILNLPFAAISGISTGVQNARGIFLIPAASAALGGVSNILVIVLGRGPLGSNCLAWGALTSMAVQASVTFVPIAGRSFAGLMPPGDWRVRQLARTLAPIILFGFIVRLTPVLERYFASGLQQGAVSYLAYGAKVAALLQAFVGTGIVTAAFPEMSREYTKGGVAGLARQYEKAANLLLAAMVPAVVILSVSAVPLVQVLFERGEFGHQATLAIASILPFQMGALMFTAMGDVISRAYYAQGRTFALYLFGTILILLYMAAANYAAAHMGYRGIALVGLARASLGVPMMAAMLGSEFGLRRHAFLVRRAICGVAAAVPPLLLNAMPVLHSFPMLLLVLSVASGIAAYAASLFVVDRETMGILVGQISKSRLVSRLMRRKAA